MTTSRARKLVTSRKPNWRDVLRLVAEVMNCGFVQPIGPRLAPSKSVLPFHETMNSFGMRPSGEFNQKEITYMLPGMGVRFCERNARAPGGPSAAPCVPECTAKA